jgi:hypothetical protein
MKWKNYLVYILFGSLIFFILPVEKKYFDTVNKIETNLELAKEQVKVLYQDNGGGIHNEYPINMPLYIINVEKVFPTLAIIISSIISIILILINPLHKLITSDNSKNSLNSKNDF